MNLKAEIGRYTQAGNARPPQRLGQRYDATGFLPEAGNTVVCALNREDPAHQAVLAAREAMMGLPGAEKFLFTPAGSLHMTVFEGVIDTRRAPDAWPDGLDPAVSVAEASRVIETRLAAFQPPPPFAVRVAGIRPTGLLLAGATPEDAAHMTAWRAALTRPFGFRHREHDSYRFHMTFGYPLAWLTEAEVPAWEAGLATILATLEEAAPVMPLGPPAFCAFADMTLFAPRVVLAR